MTKEMKRPTSNITQDSIKPSLSKAVEFCTNSIKQAHKCIQERDEYINFLESELKEARDLQCEANNQAAKEYIDRCEAESKLKSLKSQLQQQALPVVPECVGVAIESLPDNYSAFEAISLINAKIDALPEENKDWLPVYNWLCEDVKNQDIFALAFITGKYEVEKPQLFKLIFPNSTAVLQKNGELNSFADTVYKRYLIGNAMTEQEIKSIDERYWQFAVPVEDGE